MTHLYQLFKSKSCLLLLLFALAASPSKAHTYYVDTVGNSGLGTLRAAIDSANANLGYDSIIIQLTSQDTINLLSALPTITDSLVITGLPCQNPTINGGGLSFNGSTFHSTTANGPLVLNYLNIINCVDTAANAQGGAVRAHQLYVNNCYFAGDKAFPNTGNGKGGALYAVNCWINNSTFFGNTASGLLATIAQGGALFSLTMANLSNCTFDSNYAQGYGGAILIDSLGTLTNCTITDNDAGVWGGGVSGTNSASIANSIIWNNTATSSGAGIYFAGVVTSSGCNVLQASGANFNFTVASSDVSGTDPMLDTIGYFNGCVPVIPILCGSVAQNHATCTGATTSDAEGIPAYGIRDAGAFEITPPNVGGDTIDSIQPGTTADLMSLFNTGGLNFYFIGHYTDSTLVDTGTYIIIATNYLGCSDTAVAIVRYAPIDTMVDTATAIRALNSTTQGISVFPNPAEDMVNVKLTRPADGPMALKIFDATGRIARTQNLVTASGTGSFSVSGLSDGLYYIEITDSTGRFYCAKLNVIVR